MSKSNYITGKIKSKFFKLNLKLDITEIIFAGLFGVLIVPGGGGSRALP